MAQSKKLLGIYIHIPFCRSKCLYCDFCSVPIVPQRNGERISAYVKRLIEDIESYKTNTDYLPADTIYFGGGTPTLLSCEQLKAIMWAVKNRFGISDSAEITCECNPKTVDIKKLSEMWRAGINRLSIGMQSADGTELHALGRTHSYADVKNTVNMAREAGFSNISLDIMYGIPNQTLDSLNATLDAALELSCEHLSLYALKIEEGTPYSKMREKLNLPNDDMAADMYSRICERLAEKGYNKYEISNFARAGFESRHNLKYWKYDDYLGFGVAAHSFTDNKRIECSRNIDGYIAGENIVESISEIGELERTNEYVMLAMRLLSGVDILEFECRFGRDFFILFGEKFKKFAPEYVILENGKCRFTEKGFFVSNYILAQVLDF